jgi:guanylate kinase
MVKRNPKMKKSAGFPIVVSSPSGGGKTTISAILLKKIGFLSGVGAPKTRDARACERNKIDYNFHTEKQFKNLINKKVFAEWAKVHKHYYGTPKNSIEKILKEGKNPLLIIDVQGAKSIKKLYPESVLIFIIPPSLDELKKRLEGRHTSKTEMKVRLQTATKELASISKYDYLVVNDTLNKAVEDVYSVITAERLKMKRRFEVYKRKFSNKFK